jgi:hypothetical protein
MGDKWSKYYGGKGDNGKIGVMNKEEMWKNLADEIAKAGIMVTKMQEQLGLKSPAWSLSMLMTLLLILLKL